MTPDLLAAVQTAALLVIMGVLIFMAILMRTAAMTLAKDMRTLMEEVAKVKVRLDELEGNGDDEPRG
jgi:hypothetical protein